MKLTKANIFKLYKRIIGVEVKVNDAHLSYNYVLLEEKQNEVSIISSGMDASIDAITLLQLPIALCITGDIILTKQLSLNGLSKRQFEIQDFLPNALDADFLLDYSQVQEEVIAQIARKDSVETVVAVFKDCFITSVHLGVFPILFFKDSLLKEEREIVTDENVLIFTDQSVRVSSNQRELEYKLNYTFNDFSIAYSLLTAFCVGIIGQQADTSNSEKLLVVKNNREQYFHQKAFQVGLNYALPFFLLLLLLNFGLYSYFTTTLSETKAKMLSEGISIGKTDSLLSLLESKKSYLEKNGWMEKTRIARYADEIASTNPVGIHWMELTFSPKHKEQDDYYTFDENKIQLKGNAANAFELNDWQKNLQKKEFIRSIEIESLKKRVEENDILFSINISLK